MLNVKGFSKLRAARPQDTWTSLPASVSLHLLPTRIGQNISWKIEVPQFWPCLFLFRRCHMHLHSHLMRAGGQILWKKTEPSHQRIADDWFCNFQSWHTHKLGCICRSDSCKQWKGKVIKRTSYVPRNSVICFFKIDKACKEIFAILPRFLEDLVRGAVTRTKTALAIWFHYFSAFPFKILAYTFSGKLRSDILL